MLHRFDKAMHAKASLPMYDWPEIRDATEAFWRGFAQHAGIDAVLDRREDYRSLWQDPDLIFSQTCGYPFMHEFKGQLSYVATPHYAAKGCEGPNYSSVILARDPNRKQRSDLLTPAINSRDSMSGMLALKLGLRRKDINPCLVTGSHVASLAAVQTGKAEVCAIDAVVWELARRHRPQLLYGLHVIAHSPSVPGLPFVTRSGDVGHLRDALRKSFDDPALASARKAMLLTGFSILPVAAYDVIPDLEARL